MSYHTPHCGGSIEVFEIWVGMNAVTWVDDEGNPYTPDPGWYWVASYPGCLDDGEPMGPFDTEEEAITDGMGEPE